MGKDSASYNGSQNGMYDSFLKRPVFQKPENYSSYHDGKIAKQIFVKILKEDNGKS